MANNRATAYHNMSVMLDAGLPTLRALEAAVDGLHGPLKTAFSHLGKAVSEGESLGQTMAKYPSIFSPLDITIIDSAETSGNLPEAFKLLGNWYEFTDRMKRRMVSGLMLPLIVLNIAAFVSPLPNFILGRSSLAGYLGSVIGILSIFYFPAILVFAIMYLTKRQDVYRILFDNVIVKIPLFGSAVYKLALSRFCRAFHMLYKAGIPIIYATEKAVNACGNSYVATLLTGGVASAKAGEQITVGFSKKLPLEFMQIWQTGEDSGTLDDSSKRLADMYSYSAEMLLTQFANWLPRIVYFLVALLIIFLLFQAFTSVRSSMMNF
jgi:type II secretory pathway component PulF